MNTFIETAPKHRLYDAILDYKDLYYEKLNAEKQSLLVDQSNLEQVENHIQFIYDMFNKIMDDLSGIKNRYLGDPTADRIIAHAHDARLFVKDEMLRWVGKWIDIRYQLKGIPQ